VRVRVEHRSDVKGVLLQHVTGSVAEQHFQQIQGRLGPGIVEPGDVGTDKDRGPLIRIHLTHRGDPRD